MRSLVRLVGMACSFMLLIALWPSYAHGEDRSFDITNVEIHARIDRDGNMHVTEYDTYEFSGYFNGILVYLDTNKAYGIENFQAYELDGLGEKALDHDLTTSGSVHEYKVYAPSENVTKVFKLTYTMERVARVHPDTAEFYWQFFNDLNPSPIGRVVVEVELPGDPGDGKVFYFAHGVSSGEAARPADHIVRYETGPLAAGQMFEVRVLFPAWLMPGGWSGSDKPMLEKILKEEEEWARTGKPPGGSDWSIIGAVLVLAANVAYGIRVVRKYNKRIPRGKWQGEYYRELPSDASPAIVSFLMDFKVEPRDLMATLTDLVRRKYVTVTERKKKKGKDYVFQLTYKNREELRPHEQSLVTWFFEDLGKNESLALSDLKKFAEDFTKAKEFRERFIQWQKEVKDAAQEQGYVLVRGEGVYTMMLLATIVQIVVILFLFPEDWKWNFLGALPLPLFYPLKNRRTELGDNEYKKWKAFRRFLRDYSRIGTQEPLAVYLWEHYLVYAIPLGVAKKMEQVGRINVKNEDASWLLYSGTFWIGFDEWTTSIKGTIDSGKDPLFSVDDFLGSFTPFGGGGGGGGGGRGAF